MSFKKNGPAHDAATYGASIRQVIAQLASYVDVWPANEPSVGDSWLPGEGGARPWYTWCYASHGDDARLCDQSPWGLAAGLLSAVRLWVRSASS